MRHDGLSAEDFSIWGPNKLLWVKRLEDVWFRHGRRQAMMFSLVRIQYLVAQEQEFARVRA